MIALLASIPGGTTLMSRFFGKRSFTGPRLARLDERNNILDRPLEAVADVSLGACRSSTGPLCPKSVYSTTTGQFRRGTNPFLKPVISCPFVAEFFDGAPAGPSTAR
jgi:hypothetical protein